ncbi:MAG: MFS transporter [Pseudomonadota bacterium]
MIKPFKALAEAVHGQGRGLSLLLLSVAGFMIVSTEFIVVGILPLISRDLGVSIEIAGWLVTLFALTVAISGPPLTALLSGMERRMIFTAIAVIFAVSNLLAALSPDFGWLAVARIVPAMALPVFWSLAVASARDMAPAGQEGAAVSKVFVGIALASVAGLPLGTILAGAFGWRVMFLVFAGLALAIALLLYALLPSLPGRPVAIATQMRILRDTHFLAHLSLGALAFAAMFTGYTYIADMLERAGFDATMTGIVLIAFGGVGLVGNWLAGKFVDRSPLGATLVSAFIGAAATLVAAFSGAQPAILLLALVPWGMAHASGFLVNTVRVTAAGAGAPELAAALNASVANIGIALGAFIGGTVLAIGGFGAVGTATMVLAALVLIGGWLLAGAAPQGVRHPAHAQ